MSRIALLLVLTLALLPTAFAATPGGSAGTFAIQTDIPDGGGRASSSAAFSQVGSVSSIVGTSSSAGFSAGHGYIAQIAGFAAPTLSPPFQNKLIQMGSNTGALPFTVSGYQTPVASVTVTATSDNPTLVPNGNLVFGGGTSANRTLTVNPDITKFGKATITVTATDTSGGSTSYSFLVDVNAPPVLATNSAQSVNSNSFRDISNQFLKTTDGDNTDAQLIYTVTAVPTNGFLRIYPVFNPALQTGGTAIIAGSTFTQADIDNLLVRYTNQAGSQDSFTFALTDNRGGSLTGKVFNFTVGASAGSTSTVPGIPTVSFSTLDQPSIPVTATVMSGSIPVNIGSVTFQVKDVNGGNVGSAVTTSNVANGIFSTNYTIPGGTAIGFYTLNASYSGVDSLKGSVGNFNFAVVQPGGTKPPSILPLTVDRNPALVSTPVTITANAQSNSGLPLTYQFMLFNHGNATPIKTLQSGSSPILSTTFTQDGDFDISVVVSDGVNANAASANLEVFPLGPNTAVQNILNANGFTNPANKLGITVSNSQGAALNIDATVSGAVPAAAGDTYAFTFPSQVTRKDPNRKLTGAKFTQAGIQVIQLDATIAGVQQQARIMVPVGQPEIAASSINDDRGSKTYTSVKISGAIAVPAKTGQEPVRVAKKIVTSVKITVAVPVPSGLAISDISPSANPMDIGISSLHTTVSLDPSKGKVTSLSDTGHFQKLQVKLPKLDKTKKTVHGGQMVFSFTISGADAYALGFVTDGVAASTATALQFAAVIGGVTYYGTIPIAIDSIGNVKAR